MKLGRVNRKVISNQKIKDNMKRVRYLIFLLQLG